MLDRITSPADLKGLTYQELNSLASEIRDFLVSKVAKTGGHLGPNLGVVELTLAIHRVFESPKDPILWDTGHQAYVHKIVTGRANQFDNLRQENGLSGYPSREESIHDVIENSHASTALSYADGIAKAFEIHGEKDRHVVAVVGDGALTGGMTWEAINNIADGSQRSIVIVVNDNERSYSPTIGGMAHHLATLRTTKGYEKFLEWGKGVLERAPVGGHIVFEALHGMKKGIKDFVAPQGMFEDLGIKYIGPVDGHNVEELEFALQRARDFGAPVIVHAITEKGRGYRPAEQDDAEKFHAVGVVDPEDGKPIKASAVSWTNVFSDELVALGNKRQDIVAITAAMLGPTGLEKFKANFPDRTFDVGIAEQHAVTSAAGMAHAGLHPVVAVYSTFLNRAFDQVIMDCALHNAGVTFVLDRAGITGDDGPSHNGMWDLALLRIVPTLELAAPRDGEQLKLALNKAVEKSDHPTVVRFPKGALAEPVLAQKTLPFADVLVDNSDPDVTIISIGALAGEVIKAAEILKTEGYQVRVIDPVWSLPINPALVADIQGSSLVVTVEDGVVSGGIGEAIASALRNLTAEVPVVNLGIQKEFLPQANRAVLLTKFGLDAKSIANSVRQKLQATVG